MKLKQTLNHSLKNIVTLKHLPLVLIFLFVNLVSAQTPEPAPALKALHWHPDNGRIAVGYADGRVEVIAAATSEVLFTFSDADGSADNVLWSHDGSKFAAGIGKKIYIWDSETFKPQHILEGHENPVESIAWGPDNVDLVSVSFSSPERGQLKFWNTSSGQERLSKAILADSLTWDVTQDRLATLIPLNIVILDPSTAEYTPLCDNCLSDAT